MSWVIWISGLPGSGKTTLAQGVVQALRSRGQTVSLLDLPGIRHALLPAGAASERDEELVHRALAFTAMKLCEAGIRVVVDATTPRRRWREVTRALIPVLAEVQLMCAPELCGNRERAVRWGLGPEGREPRTLEAGAGPELVLGYEYSLTPDLAIHTDVKEVWAATEEILALAQRLERAAHPATRPERRLA
jgi:adenylylsulfate kinase-like enzyme